MIPEKDKIEIARYLQKRESWIKNVMNKLGKTREEATELYNKIHNIKIIEARDEGL